MDLPDDDPRLIELAKTYMHDGLEWETVSAGYRAARLRDARKDLERAEIIRGILPAPAGPAAPLRTVTIVELDAEGNRVKTWTRENA